MRGVLKFILGLCYLASEIVTVGMLNSYVKFFSICEVSYGTGKENKTIE